MSRGRKQDLGTGLDHLRNIPRNKRKLTVSDLVKHTSTPQEVIDAIKNVASKREEVRKYLSVNLITSLLGSAGIAFVAFGPTLPGTAFLSAMNIGKGLTAAFSGAALFDLNDIINAYLTRRATAKEVEKYIDSVSTSEVTKLLEDGSRKGMSEEEKASLRNSLPAVINLKALMFVFLVGGITFSALGAGGFVVSMGAKEAVVESGYEALGLALNWLGNSVLSAIAAQLFVRGAQAAGLPFPKGMEKVVTTALVSAVTAETAVAGLEMGGVWKKPHELAVAACKAVAAGVGSLTHLIFRHKQEDARDLAQVVPPSSPSGSDHSVN